MSEFRIELRQRLKSHVLDKTSAEDRVFVSRKNPFKLGQQYPLILIYSGPESAVESKIKKGIYIRNHTLTFELRVEGITEGDPLNSSDSDEVDDNLDLLASQITELMKSFEMPGLKDISYTGSDPELDDSGETTFGSLRLNFDFQYIY